MKIRKSTFAFILIALVAIIAALLVTKRDAGPMGDGNAPSPAQRADTSSHAAPPAKSVGGATSDRSHPTAGSDTVAGSSRHDSSSASHVRGGTLSSAEAKRAVAAPAAEAIAALKGKDIAKLAALAHPIKGIQFDPYPNVSGQHFLRFQGKELPSLWGSGRKYKWGSYDATGEPITLTFKNYYNRFIYDRDYIGAKQIAYNGELLGKGNLINDLHDAYPDAVVVEYHFPGFDPQFGGMDWKSLWLMFEQQGAEWYLVAIAHGEWTI